MAAADWPNRVLPHASATVAIVQRMHSASTAHALATPPLARISNSLPTTTTTMLHPCCDAVTLCRAARLTSLVHTVLAAPLPLPTAHAQRATRRHSSVPPASAHTQRVHPPLRLHVPAPARTPLAAASAARIGGGARRHWSARQCGVSAARTGPVDAPLAASTRRLVAERPPHHATPRHIMPHHRTHTHACGHHCTSHLIRLASARHQHLATPPLSLSLSPSLPRLFLYLSPRRRSLRPASLLPILLPAPSCFAPYALPWCC